MNQVFEWLSRIALGDQALDFDNLVTGIDALLSVVSNFEILGVAMFREQATD